MYKTQKIIVNPPLRAIEIASLEQHITVSPAQSSFSIVLAGPMGPAGPPGTSDAISDILTVDGQLLTRETGVLAPITRVDLANDPAFMAHYGAIWVNTNPPPTPTDGEMWWDIDDVSVVPPLSALDMSNDSAFTSKYGTTVNHGSVAATARKGTAPCQWIGSVNPTNATDDDRLYRTDQTAFYVRVAGAWVEIGSLRFVPAATAWTNLTLAGTWVNFDAGHPAQYRKVGDDVEIRGLVKSGTIGSTINSTPLPAGFLPFQTDESFVQGGSGVTGLVSVFKATGQIVPAAPLTNAFVYLSGIKYSTVA
jgi:hypothetical protein